MAAEIAAPFLWCCTVRGLWICVSESIDVVGWEINAPLKKHLTLEYVNLTLRKIRTKRDIQWQTNEIPRSGWMTVMSHPEEL